MPTPFSDGGNENDNVYVSAVMVKIMSVAQREEKAPSQKLLQGPPRKERIQVELVDLRRSSWNESIIFRLSWRVNRVVKWLFLVF